MIWRRFEKLKHSERDIVKAFAKKEFKNLQLCEQAGIHAPRPVYAEKNVVVMTFLGEAGIPYPTMNTTAPRSENDLESVITDLQKMYRAGLVHADVSEYNMLLADVPYLIDFGQGVVSRHPNAEKFLERDVQNVLHYFAKFGYHRDSGEVMQRIKS